MALKGSINLNDLKGSVNKRGRDRYANAELATLLQQLADGKIPFVVWDELYTADKKTPAKTITNERAKWRNRAVSVFEALNTDKKVSIHWTDAHEMVIQLASA
jgi:hypothetical protein